MVPETLVNLLVSEREAIRINPRMTVYAAGMPSPILNPCECKVSLFVRKIRFAVVLIAAILVGSEHGSADDPLELPDNSKPTESDFKLKVTLLGYIQQSGHTTALIQVGDEANALTFVLEQGIKLAVDWEVDPDLTSIRFDQIDHDNRSIKLVFEAYKPKTCRMLSN